VTGRARRLAASLLAAATVGWLDPSATPREAARLYGEGKFDDAAARYNQALIDAPDSTLLHFNLGDAEYRRGQFDAASRAFQAIPDDAAAEYNRGNALFRTGEAAAEEKPEEALRHWAEALIAYRRAIALDAADEDAKFNYEWVTRKIDELRQKLEDQQQQEQQNQDQQNQDQQGQEGEQEQPQGQQDQHGQDEPQAEQPEPPRDESGGRGEAPEPPPPAEPTQAEAVPAPSDGSMSRDEATALLDGERGEELQPDEVIRRQLGTGDVPVQDW
jgi:Ca-activated chloride channel family protein